MWLTQGEPQTSYLSRLRWTTTSEVAQALLIKSQSLPRYVHSAIRVYRHPQTNCIRVITRTVHMFSSGCFTHWLQYAQADLIRYDRSGPGCPRAKEQVLLLSSRLTMEMPRRLGSPWRLTPLDPLPLLGMSTYQYPHLSTRWDASRYLYSSHSTSNQIDGVLTNKNAGGNCTYPTFMLNPQYHLRIHPPKCDSQSRRAKAKIALTMQTSRDIPANITLVWSQGERIDEYVDFPAPRSILSNEVSGWSRKNSQEVQERTAMVWRGSRRRSLVSCEMKLSCIRLTMFL